MPDKRTAADAFMSAYVRIGNSIQKLLIRYEDHFDVDPENLNWGDVGDLNRIADLLDRIENKD